MNDALAALENAGDQIDAWLDAAGPLRQQLADAITAARNLLAADAQAALADAQSDKDRATKRTSTPTVALDGATLDRLKNLTVSARSLLEKMKHQGADEDRVLDMDAILAGLRAMNRARRAS